MFGLRQTQEHRRVFGAETPRPLDLHGPTGPEHERFPDDCVDRPIFALFRETARRHADREAVDDGELRLSYRDLLATAEALAQRLSAIPAGSGAIGLLLPNTALYPVAALACLAAGRPYVALDAHYPAERNADLIADARLDALLVHGNPSEAGVALPAGLACIRVADFLPSSRLMPAVVPPQPPPCPAPPDAAALIIYTSGSSGRPKGVVNSQASIVQRVRQYAEAAHIGADDRICPLSSPSTISGVREQLTALLTGAALQVVDPQRSGLQDVRRILAERRVTCIYAVPALLRTLARTEEAARDLACLRNVRIGGDMVLWSDIALLRRVLAPDCRIQIGFSSTETPGLQWFIPPGFHADGAAVPIGYTLPGVAVSLCDEAGATPHPGGVGELVVRSRYVGLGLWRDGACVPGPFTPDPQDPLQRVFHTGDLARRRPDGLYAPAGRKDRQVKIRGQRVEPAELEAVLRLSSEVLDAAVITAPTLRGAELVAFVVPQPNAGPGLVEELQAAVAATLPRALRPSAIHLLAEMPRLPSAKIDLAALARLRRGRPAATGRRGADGRHPRAAPGASGEVLRVWRRVLGRRAAMRDPTWSGAGGDSLALLDFVFRLECRLKVQIPLDLFHLDMRLSEFMAAVAGAARPKAAPLPRSGQEALFLLPGIDGDEPLLAMFRQELRESFRFTTLGYPEWWETMRDGGSLDGFADSLADAIAAEQPTGALRLAGYSFGGIVAYAVALRLRARGRDIALLGLLDTDLEAARTATEPGALAAAWWHARPPALWHGGLSDAACMLLARGLLREGRRALAARWLGHNRRIGLPEHLRFLLHRHLRITLRRDISRRWLRALQAGAADIPAVLFRSEEHGAAQSPDLGWRSACRDVTVVQVSGDHHTMFQHPHRAALARHFAQAMRPPAPAEAGGAYAARPGLLAPAGERPLALGTVPAQRQAC